VGSKKQLKQEPVQKLGYDLILKKKLWKKLNGFLKKTGAGLVFTLSCGWSDRDKRGVWMEENARRLISYSVKKNFPIYGWELGNEINGYPYLEGFRRKVSAQQYTEDYRRFSCLIRELHPSARAIGPASAVWPFLGELNPIIPSLTMRGVASARDVISWHYYPQQSRRGKVAVRRVSLRTPLRGNALEEVRKWARKIQCLAGKREVWVTETGHALYGGEPGASDTYLSTLWWLNQMGILAQEGITHVFRQTLVGSDYGLLDPETFEPRPDYYASFLWKRLMGTEVFKVSSLQPRHLKVYLHNSAIEGYQYCALVVNLSARTMGISLYMPPAERYVITPGAYLCSRHIFLNGVLVEPELVEKWGKKKMKKKYRVVAEEIESNYADSTEEWHEEIPPYGSGFYLLPVDRSRG
jgi:heparanase 1